MQINRFYKEKKYQVIIALALILVFILIFKSLFNKKEVAPINIQPTPTSFILTPTTFQPPAQGDPDFYESVRPEILKNYPLFDFIPNKTNNWKIDYLRPLVLEIVLKKDTPEIRKEVLDWIESKGVDPASHQIEWKIQ